MDFIFGTRLEREDDGNGSERERSARCGANALEISIHNVFSRGVVAPAGD